MSNKSDRNVMIDYLRVFAMLAVFLCHMPKKNLVPDQIVPVFRYGAYGVQIFFVISGYLAFLTYNNNNSVAAYYRKRAIRILPSYYVGIILAIIIKTVMYGVYTDVFRIGYLRYFLGIQTLLPSDNYIIWNNMYGFWTMSCFIWFYILFPFIAKYVTSLKRSILFYLFTYAFYFVWKPLNMRLFGMVGGLDSLDVCIGGSIFGTLYYFGIGIVTYYMLKESRYALGAAIGVLTILLGVYTGKTGLIFSVITALMIIIGQKISIRDSKIIKFLGDKSLYIYLSQVMAFELSANLIKMSSINAGEKEALFVLPLSFVIIIFVVFIMDRTDKLFKLHFSSK